MKFLGHIVISMMLFFSADLFAKEALTGAKIEKFLESMKEIEKWSEKNEHRFKDDEDDDPMNMTVEKIMADVKAAKAYGEVENIVKKYGFDSPEAWADTMVRVMKAAMANAMSQVGDHQKQMEAQMQKFMNDPSVPAETKAMMQQSMAQSMSMMKQSSQADPADVAAVKPYMDRLQNEMMSEGD